MDSPTVDFVAMLSIPFSLQKTTTIKRDPQDVCSSLTDFHQWGEWSPWLCQEPGCPVDITGKAATIGEHSMTWHGQTIGEGTLQLLAIDPHANTTTITYALTFLKPWKSRSTVHFHITPQNGSTQVRWSMQGSLPIFLFFLRSKMSAWVGSDYRRGLSMLKDFLENGSVPSKTAIEGTVQRDPLYYLGKRRTCQISTLSESVRETFQELMKQPEGERPAPHQSITLYHLFDLIGDRCDYTVGVLYDTPQQSRSNLVAGQLEAHQALHIQHWGAYRHLGNAWSTAMLHLRSTHKPHKTLPMYEIYKSDLDLVEEKDIEVSIYAPLRT